MFEAQCFKIGYKGSNTFAYVNKAPRLEPKGGTRTMSPEGERYLEPEE